MRKQEIIPDVSEELDPPKKEGVVTRTPTDEAPHENEPPRDLNLHDE